MIAQGRYFELITVDPDVKEVGSYRHMVSGWRNCYDVSCTVDADGGDPIRTSKEYISTKYNTDNIGRPSLNLGCLVGMWCGVVNGEWVASDPFKVGSAHASYPPSTADRLLLGFHDRYGWNTNYGSYKVSVTFEAHNPQTYTIYATQCLYFYFTPTDAIGPNNENIDDGNDVGPHLPTEIEIPYPSLLTSIEVNSNIAKVEDANRKYPYLKLQRYLFDPEKYATLAAEEMVWKKGHVGDNYSMFLLDGNSFENIESTYDVAKCRSATATIVAVKIGINSTKSQVLNAINHNQILPNRI